MSATSKINLFTSIPPCLRRPVQGRDFGAAWQAACVESWKASGFHVVSLNEPDEIDALRPFEGSVDFIELPAGRGRPLITDFLAAAAKSGGEAAGIINADCLLIPQTRLAERLAENLDGVVIAERVNLSRATLRPTGQSCHGFDAFFFATKALAAIEQDDSWRIGDTWWDYWLPLSFLLAGFEPKTLPAPMLVHLDHDQAWDKRAWESNCRRLLDVLRPRKDGLGDPDLAAAVEAAPPALQEIDVYKLSQRIFVWLRSHEPLWRPKEGSADDLLTRVLTALATPPEPPPQTAGGGRANPLRRALDMLGLR